MNTATTRVNRLLAPALLALASTAASGDVIISNLTSNSTSGTAFGTCSTAVFQAAGFTMPRGLGYSLDQVLIEMDYEYNGGGEAGRYSLWEGAGVPTRRIVTLDPVSPLIGAGVFSFTPASATWLLGGRTYWLYVEPSTPPGGCMLWVGGDADPSGLAINAGYILNGNPSTFRNKYEVQGSPPCPHCSCEWDPDPACNIFDFLAFQTAFVAGDPCACELDPDPACNIFDFLAFQNQFVCG